MSQFNKNSDFMTTTPQRSLNNMNGGVYDY
jgi:hypothetical protein